VRAARAAAAGRRAAAKPDGARTGAQNKEGESRVLGAARQVAVFGGGSFGTAIGCALARQKPDLVVTLLLRDPRVCADINTLHVNTRYLKARAAAGPGPPSKPAAGALARARP
jgi:pimeloyl-ACP methyl ester carboxylesterase